MTNRIWFLIGVLAAASASAQTQVDLRTQGKSVDFSNVVSTRPVKTGATLPASCAVGELFFKSNSPAGQNLYACHAENSWSVITASATQSNQLLDLSASRTSNTVLTIGGGCSAGAPCNVRIGNVTYSITSPALATVQSGIGTALIYIASNGQLTVGHNVTLSCNSGCTAVAGVTEFPAGSIPLSTWTVFGGQWNETGLLDLRAYQSAAHIVAGTGLESVQASGIVTLNVDRAMIGVRVPVPAAATDACVSGAWAADASFLYLCHAANTWKRVAVASW